MDLEFLYRILKETTVPLRKGEIQTERIVGNVKVIEYYGMPHVNERQNLEKVDMHYIVVGVDKEKADLYRREFIRVIKTYPDLNRFREGLSYIEIGGIVDSQEAALQLMALGKVLGLWNIMTPEKMGAPTDMRDELAGRGFILITGVKGEI